MKIKSLETFENKISNRSDADMRCHLYRVRSVYRSKTGKTVMMITSTLLVYFARKIISPRWLRPGPHAGGGAFSGCRTAAVLSTSSVPQRGGVIYVIIIIIGPSFLSARGCCKAASRTITSSSQQVSLPLHRRRATAPRTRAGRTCSYGIPEDLPGHPWCAVRSTGHGDDDAALRCIITHSATVPLEHATTALRGTNGILSSRTCTCIIYI